jgi:hypothetical protein
MEGLWKCFSLARLYIIQEHTFGQKLWDRLRCYLGIHQVHFLAIASFDCKRNRKFYPHFVHHHFEWILLQELEISIMIHTNPYTFNKAKIMLGWVHSLNVFPMDCYPNISSGFRGSFPQGTKAHPPNEPY